jgi:transcriptional regulator with XRE-family HTH domain
VVKQRWVVRNGSDLGEAIGEIRSSRGLTQAELSEQLGVSRTWLAKLERGRTTNMVDLLVRLLRNMGATILVEFDDQTSSSETAGGQTGDDDHA